MGEAWFSPGEFSEEGQLGAISGQQSQLLGGHCLGGEGPVGAPQQPSQTPWRNG